MAIVHIVGYSTLCFVPCLCWDVFWIQIWALASQFWHQCFLRPFKLLGKSNCSDIFKSHDIITISLRWTHLWCGLIVLVKGVKEYTDLPSLDDATTNAPIGVRWLSGKGIGLLIKRLPVRFPAAQNDVVFFGQGTSPYLPRGECPCTYYQSLCIRASATWLNVMFTRCADTPTSHLAAVDATLAILRLPLHCVE